MSDYVKSVNQVDDQGLKFDIYCQAGDTYTAWYHSGEGVWYFDFPGEEETPFDSVDDVVDWLNSDDMQ